MNILDKIDLAIFKNLNENHKPSTFKAMKFVFIGGMIISLLVFILQNINIKESTGETITAILLLGLIAGMFVKVWDTLKSFPTWWKAAIYGLYLLVLTTITFSLAMWAFIIAFAGIIIYLIYKIFFAPDKSKKEYKIHFKDGTTQKGELEGTGICGEKYIKDEDGNTHIVP